MGYTALDYTSSGVMRVVVVTAVLGAVGIALGLAWFGRRWLYFAALFFVPFVLLYTTFFLRTRKESRVVWSGNSATGSNNKRFKEAASPYYYAFLMIPMYEFLPALGAVLAAGIGLITHYGNPDRITHLTGPNRIAISTQSGGSLTCLLVGQQPAGVLLCRGEDALADHPHRPPDDPGFRLGVGWLVETVPWADWSRGVAGILPGDGTYSFRFPGSPDREGCFPSRLSQL